MGIKDFADMSGERMVDWVWMIMCLLFWPLVLAAYFDNTR